MNIVIACGKSVTKQFKEVFQSLKEHRVLGYENSIRNGFAEKITNDYNPHILMIVKGVSFNKTTLEEIIINLKAIKPYLRIIYINGEIDNEADFKKTAEILVNNEVYDIVTSLLSIEKIKTALEVPMTYEEVKGFIEEKDEGIYTEEKQVLEIEEIAEEQDSNIEEIPNINLTEDDSEFDFNFSIIERVIEHEKEVKEVVGNITIALKSLLRGSGCTHTAIEIATFLKDKGKDVALVLKNPTYKNFATMNVINNSNEHYIYKGITFYPFENLQIAQSNHRFLVADFGLIDKATEQNEYNRASLKCLMCPSADWDIDFLTDFLKANKEKNSKIVYLFNSLSRAKFLSLKENLSKGECVSYRITNSYEPFEPDSENCATYGTILRKYIDGEVNKGGFKWLPFMRKRRV